MKKFIILLGAVILSSTLTAQNQTRLIDSLNAFTYEFYQEMYNEQGDENLFFSPFSISTLMAMPYAGAEKETAKEFRDIWMFPESREMHRNTWDTLLTDLDSRYDDKAEFRLANSLWVNKDFELLDAYESTVKEHFNARLYQVDFTNEKSRKKARKQANKWVEDITSERIRDLITDDMLTPLTRLMLINAIYFKAAWKYPFKESATRKDTFHLDSGKHVMVDFMHEKESMRFYEDEKMKMVGIPYEHPFLEMLVVKPKEKYALARAAKQFNDTAYTHHVFSNMRYGKVQLALPKFRMKSRYALKPYFKKMGMEQAFNDSADFSGITGDKSLLISKIVHQTFIDVNEKGTEAAAATAATMMLKSSLGKNPFVFKANEPFMFYIKDSRTDLIYFAGALHNPEEKK